MAIDAMRKAYAQDEIRAFIEAQEKAECDEISRLYFAERKGREEGRQDGHEEVARRMLSSGADRTFILEVTQLSEQELAALEKEREAKRD